MSRYIELREEIGAKAKVVFNASQVISEDSTAAARAMSMDPSAAPKAVTEEFQRRVKELTALRADFEPLKAIEDAKTLASEYEREFNRPANGAIAMPGKQAEGAPPKADLGKLFVASRVYRAWHEHGDISASEIVPVDLRATLFETGAGWAVESPPPAQVSLMPKRPIAVVNWIPVVRWDQAIYSFMEETTHTDNAVEKAEGAAFGEAAFVMTKREKTIRKIPNSLPVTDEQLADVPGAEDFVSGRLEYQVRARLDLQVLAGSGVAPNLEGTENVTGIQSQALGIDTTEDAIYKMLRAIEDDGFAEADVVFIRAVKWEVVRLRKDSQGGYLYGPPQAPAGNTLWGLPVQKTNATTATKAIAGAYRAHSLLAVKQDIEFAIGYTGTQFTEGEKTIRADIRVAMVHLRPKAFGQVTGL